MNLKRILDSTFKDTYEEGYVEGYENSILRHLSDPELYQKLKELNRRYARAYAEFSGKSKDKGIEDYFAPLYKALYDEFDRRGLDHNVDFVADDNNQTLAVGDIVCGKDDSKWKVINASSRSAVIKIKSLETGDEKVVNNSDNEYKKHVSDSVVLEEGFSLGDLESYIYENIHEIRENLSNYGLTIDELRRKENYYDVATVLGCDSQVLKDYELSVVIDYIEEILSGNIPDSETDNIVDLLWILQSSGVAYESRKSLGVDKDEYKRYVMNLIEENNLTDLIGGLISDDSKSEKWDNSMIERLEEVTGYDVVNFSNTTIDVIDANGWDDHTDTIWTADETFDSVCREVLKKRVKDSEDLKIDWRVKVKEDFDRTKKEGWTDKEYDTYIFDVASGYSAPLFLSKTNAVDA